MATRKVDKETPLPQRRLALVLSSPARRVGVETRPPACDIDATIPLAAAALALQKGKVATPARFHIAGNALLSRRGIPDADSSPWRGPAFPIKSPEQPIELIRRRPILCMIRRDSS